MDIALSRWQSEVFLCPARFRPVIAGRRAGKTHLMKVELARAAINTSYANVGYWAPTWSMAKDLMWEPLKQFIPKAYLKGKPNETDLTIRLINGSRIVLRSADNPDRSRGWGWDFAALDEFAFMDWKLWTEVIRPALSDRMGSAIFGTTPYGLNHAYDLYMQGQNPDFPDWKSWQVTTLQGGRVPKSEVEEARRSLDPRTFRQEYEASFEALGGRVYDMFEKTVHVQEWVTDLGGDILVGWDFNVNPMCLVLGSGAVDQLHIFDALAVPSSNTQEVAQEVRKRYPDRSIIACPDPSGRARKTSATGGQTDFTLIESFGIRTDAPNAAPAVADRINNVQANFRTADGGVHCYIHPRAQPLIRGLMGQVYKEGTSIPEKGGFDHPNDALGYLEWQRFNRLIAPASNFRVIY